MSRQHVDYADVVQSYLTQLVGPERSGPAAQQALAEIVAQANGSGPPEIALVRKVAQRVGLDALDSEAHSLGRRLAAAAHGRWGCSRVARRLRDRSAGRISAPELDAFYRHLGRCQSCAAIAGRFEAGEWYLQVELGAAARVQVAAPDVQAEEDAAPEVQVDEDAAPEVQVGEDAAPELQVEEVAAPEVRVADEPRPARLEVPSGWEPAVEPIPVSRVAVPAADDSILAARAWSAGAPDSLPTAAAASSTSAPSPVAAPTDPRPRRSPRDGGAPCPPPATLSPPATPSPQAIPSPQATSSSQATPPSRATPSAPAWQPRRWLQALILGLAAIALAAIFVESPPGAKHAGSGAPQPSTRSTTGDTGGVTTTTPTITPTHDGVPFVVAGTRFAILLNPSQPWTAFTRSVPAGPGERWVLVTVLASNLSQAQVDPTPIDYRLTAAGGASYLPNPAHGTGDLSRPDPPTAPGALVQTELAFQVPETARDLRLSFAPTAGQHVLVPLGD